jgi:hypothetical protein
MCENVWDLNKNPNRISKPSRGLFIPATVNQAVVAEHAERSPTVWGATTGLPL